MTLSPPSPLRSARSSSPKSEPQSPRSAATYLNQATSAVQSNDSDDVKCHLYITLY